MYHVQVRLFTVMLIVNVLLKMFSPETQISGREAFTNRFLYGWRQNLFKLWRRQKSLKISQNVNVYAET